MVRSRYEGLALSATCVPSLDLGQPGAGPSLDAVAVHPYSYPALPRDPSTASWNTYERLPLLHDVMADHGDGAKQIWLTEFGAPTGTATGAVSLTTQATMARAGLLGALECHRRSAIGVGGQRDESIGSTDRPTPGLTLPDRHRRSDSVRRRSCRRPRP